MKIAVIGTGYVGLVTGTCLAESGNDVVCVDKDARQDRPARSRARCPIYEPGLARAGPAQRPRRPAALHHRPGRGGSPRPSSSSSPWARRRATTAAADLSQRLGGRPTPSPPHLNGPKIVVIKSTVPVGTNAELARRMAEVHGVPFDVASNPEFLKEGAAIDDFMKPDRVVVGVRRPEVGERAAASCTPRSCGPTGRSWSCRPRAPR